MSNRQSTARISPLSSTLLIFGIIFLGVAGPVGVALLIAAWLVQRNYRQGVLGRRAAADEEAFAKQLEAARRF